MKSVTVNPAAKKLSGELRFPGDKSLSHRAIMFGALAEGRSRFTNVLSGEDCVCTREAFEAMGVRVRAHSASDIEIEGAGLRGLKAPAGEIYLGNSGTSMRILMGILSGQPFAATLSGDPSLSSRPMKRVTTYLRQMGASIEGRDDANFAPLTVKGGKLKPIDATLAVSSAQVKSAILLAGLYADGTTSVTEPELSRDHTERFLEYFGGKVKRLGLKVSVDGGQALKARSFEIAGDVSSAAFFMAAALLVKDSRIEFRSILDNPTRTGIVEVLKRMGARFGGWKRSAGEGPEPAADFYLESQELTAFDIPKKEIPSLVDEIPILCVLATQAKGRSVVHDADELRVKETDRIASMVTMLSKMGASIRAEGNTILIEGPTPLKGALVESWKDHRTAMSLIVAGLIAEGKTIVRDVECINTSFPNFFELLKYVGGDFKLDTP